jgi:hypothetical protein
LSITVMSSICARTNSSKARSVPRRLLNNSAHKAEFWRAGRRELMYARTQRTQS